MAYLRDTHTFLWLLEGSNRLPAQVANLLKDRYKPCYLSVASLWEITIKVQIGKLRLGFDLETLYRYARANQIEILPINEQHLNRLCDLEFIHRDPFDRMIVAQAISENLILITRDEVLKGYPVQVRWK